MILGRHLVALLILLVLTTPAIAEEGIPNIQFKSTYTSGNEVIYKFQDGILEYQFVAGHMKGAFGKNLAFKSRAIDEQIYLVSWHDTNNAFYMTLVVDLKNKREHFTSIVGYTGEEPSTPFLVAEITDVAMLE